MPNFREESCACWGTTVRFRLGGVWREFCARCVRPTA